MATKRKNKHLAGIPVAVRLQRDIVAELDDLAAWLTETTRNPTGRADAIRLTMARGLKALKAER
jgi:hypothetical protein